MSWISFVIIFFTSALLGWLLTLIARVLALRFSIVDSPTLPRKKHNFSTPLLGGSAIFFSFWLIMGCLYFFTNTFNKNIGWQQLLVLFLTSFGLVVLGLIDDIKKISAKLRLLIISLVALVVVFLIVDLTAITNPFGGILNLAWLDFALFGQRLIIIGDLVAFVWLIVITNTVKILDGLDGLATGISAIGALVIFLLASTPKYFQPDVRMMALVLAGVCFGFLILNFYPAKIFLGESGGLFLGFMVGILAIVSGGKIATAVLVLAIPILDLLWVIYNRAKNKESIFSGDRRHLHFRLLDSGMSHCQAVIFLYALAALFGVSALVLPSFYKLLALISLVIIFFVVEKIISIKEIKHEKKQII
ncbi:MAG: hypothetical protein COU31_03285 [Candidatus Magasanikbacteria bacterium CG10_big_fil_rev_8_21_14_0_10_40_10]|uniref:Undecaprenyl-phosphate alpha-N-acetylglucosaminyl 1-phosphate transferase n=1 Tax=Candidatus Magasanikbacteria bacterium CG10_big_fil_rev_8_21_14_0_10_40_10 TaxID=1974648 RepID=A0A2M6W3I7_9BACT|nr:MAG: hypothetical protein COU31_03285 [Candidatus Magasanikbacteria bacterium CG10_big_fil_rev_8_21_14_0_10_40_10]